MPAMQQRRALVVARPSERADIVRLARAAGWDALEADGFGHARFLLSMTACDGIVVADDLAGPDLLDGLGWLASHLPAPPVLVTRLAEEVVLTAMRHGVLWVPPEALRACPSMLGALLDQADGLGRQRRRAALADASLRDSEVRVERLLNMLWETAPVEGQARWFTQRHMLERLAEEVERCRRNGTPLAVVLGELAAPGGVTLPREQADRLAGWLAGAVARGKRRCDVAGHYGQHGFMMVLPQTTAEQARGACARLARLMSHPPHAAPGVRPCFALADVKGRQASVPALLRRAEELLDQAKVGGGIVAAT